MASHMGGTPSSSSEASLFIRCRFPLRSLAIQWAMVEREAMETGPLGTG